MNASHKDEPQNPSFLSDGGEMGARLRAIDWSAHVLGPPQAWPQGLRASLSICLNTTFPIAIYWGPDAILLYNDAWRPIVGNKHPWALGRPGREVWSEIWDVVGPVFDAVVATGKGQFQTDALMYMHRHGYIEECHFDYTFSPIRGQTGGVEGIFNAVNETTFRVLSDRRGRLLRELGAQLTAAKSVQEVCEATATAVAPFPADIPFMLLYILRSERKRATLSASTGIASGHPAAPATINLGDADEAVWPIGAALETGKEIHIQFHGDIPEIKSQLWPESISEAIVVPVGTPLQSGHAAVLVLGVSPRRAVDASYLDFLKNVGTHVATALATARAFEEEQSRAQALAELDRAKTQFFTNVSHELRTPLTLILGPLQDALSNAHGILPLRASTDLSVAQRNALRLLKLVNSLLDFTRIEAGRAQASYEPIDLAAFTAELASAFRSAVEKAGLRLVVDCPPIAEPTYVDRDMWEKVVLNLLSNAFKYTLEGEIRVALRAVGGRVELSVSDTGTGIPAEAVPRLFERFFRVEGAQGRTHEGTGIGLALVAELMKLHGGGVRAESNLGSGSTFIAHIPVGWAHLPPDRILAERSQVWTVAGASPFLEEAAAWLDSDASLETEAPLSPQRPAGHSDGVATIVLADDNVDMRSYIGRLLATRYRVVAVANGREALDEIAKKRPDLVLTDVMMPELDGFGLLRALRENKDTATLPVIMLSARAGEEAKIEGLQRGADDYLIKPFSARELLTRVDAQIEIARVRGEAAGILRRSEEQLRLVTDAMPALISYVDADERYRYNNRAYETWFGQKAADLYGKTMREVLGDEAYETAHSYIRRALTGEAVTFDTVMPYDSGGTRHIEATYTPDRAESGEVRGLFVMVLDVTERRRAAARDAFRLRLTDALRPLADPIEVQAEASRVLGEHLGANRVVYFEIRGDEYVIERDYTAGVQPLAGRYPVAAFGPALLSDLLKGRTIIEADATANSERSPTEREKFAAIHVRGHVDVPLVKDGRFLAGMTVHVSERREWTRHEVALIEETAERTWAAVERTRAEAALQESESRYRAVVEGQSEMVCRFHVDGTILFANGAYARAVGKTTEALEGSDFWNLIPAADRPSVRAMLDGLTPDAPEIRIENRFVTKGGERWTLWTNRGLKFDADGRLLEAQSAGIDITDRKHAEAALRESEERFRTFADTAPAMLWVTDPDGMCTFLSRGWYDFTGQTEKEALGLGWTDVIHPDDRARAGHLFLAASAAREPHFSIEHRVRRADGQYRWVIDIGRPRFASDGTFLGYVGNVIDVDEQKQTADELGRHRAHLQQMVDERTAELEASHRQLRLSERMAALGTLSTGLGHDMGNLLMPVRVRLEALAKADLPESSRKDVEAIQTSAEYLRKLSAGLRLLALNPDHATAAAATELRSWWEEAEPTLRNVVPQGIVLESRVPQGQLWAGISRPALTQAVFNLVQNAGDAMRARGSGTVTVWMEKRNDAVRVGITDDGPGMSSEVKARCMEPFYTTKPREISTGLGLALVYGLVQDAKGSIAIDTVPGQGTTFVLTLPVAEPLQTSGEHGPQSERTAAVSLKEPRLRAFVAAELRSIGFKVEKDVSIPAQLFVIDDLSKVDGNAKGWPVVLIGTPAHEDVKDVIVMGDKPALQAVREALRTAVERGSVA